MELFDVVVVGFGPVGQMMCAQLGQAGHRVAAIERQPQLYGLSRAGHIDDEVMRTFQKVGVTSEFLEDAVAWQMYDMRNKAFDGELLISLDWSKIGRHGWQEHWLFYQNNLEVALNRQVAATGNVDVRMGTEVTGFTQDQDHIAVTTRNRQTGADQVVQAKYLIAADGADSFVRRELAIPVTEGVTGPYQLVVDTVQKKQLSFDFDNGQFADPLRPGCLFQLGKTHRRWEFTLLPGEEPDEFTIDRVWQLLSPWVTPDDVEILRHPVYQFREVMADEWQRGRVFLVGDAAHLMWPYAGEGMCNGIRDVSALTWRLDLVLRGLATPTILDTYTADRKPNAQGWTDVSREIGTPCVITDPAAATERDSFLKAVQADPSLMPAATVPPGPVAFSRPGDQHAGVVGPQARIRVGEKEGLFDDLIGHGFVLITVDQELADTLTDEHQKFLNQIGARIAVIGEPGTDAPVIDIEGIYTQWLADLGRTTALVRPDFYLYGAASDTYDLIDLIDNLAKQIAF